MKIKDQSAVTLIEIVMAMVVLGLLAAIIYPKFLDHKKHATWQTTRQNQEAIEKAIEYFIVNENRLPNNDLSDLVDKGYLREIPLQHISKDVNNNVSSNSSEHDSEAGGWFWGENKIHRITTHQIKYSVYPMIPWALVNEYNATFGEVRLFDPD